MKKTICLLRIGEIDPRILIILKKNLKWFFKKYNIKVDILSDPLPLLDSEKNLEKIDSELNPEKIDYDATKMKKRLTTLVKNKNYYRILGVTNVDIFSNFRTQIFGVADQLTNESFGRAVISVCRLEEQFYRRPKNIAQFEQRVFKEAIHELGHTFGLNHCENRCVMRSSQLIEDADRKPQVFCAMCLYKLKKYLIKSN